MLVLFGSLPALIFKDCVTLIGNVCLFLFLAWYQGLPALNGYLPKRTHFWSLKSSVILSYFWVLHKTKPQRILTDASEDRMLQRCSEPRETWHLSHPKIHLFNKALSLIPGPSEFTLRHRGNCSSGFGLPREEGLAPCIALKLLPRWAYFYLPHCPHLVSVWVMQVVSGRWVWWCCWRLSFPLNGSRQQEGLKEEKGHVHQTKWDLNESPGVPSPIMELMGVRQRKGRQRDRRQFLRFWRHWVKLGSVVVGEDGWF